MLIYLYFECSISIEFRSKFWHDKPLISSNCSRNWFHRRYFICLSFVRRNRIAYKKCNFILSNILSLKHFSKLWLNLLNESLLPYRNPSKSCRCYSKLFISSLISFYYTQQWFNSWIDNYRKHSRSGRRNWRLKSDWLNRISNL
jgi:hypothetical protein